jgi:hypothetical protein
MEATFGRHPLSDPITLATDVQVAAFAMGRDMLMRVVQEKATWLWLIKS